MLNHLGTIKLETERLFLKKDEKEDKELLWKYLFSDKDAVEKCNWVNFNKNEYFFINL